MTAAPLSSSTVSGDWGKPSSDPSPPPSFVAEPQQRRRRRLRRDGGEQQQQRTTAPSLSPELELPKRTQTIPEELLSVEITLGRVAMVAAVILLATELTTGQSLPEQIMAAALCFVQ